MLDDDGWKHDTSKFAEQNVAPLGKLVLLTLPASKGALDLHLHRGVHP